MTRLVRSDHHAPDDLDGGLSLPGAKDDPEVTTSFDAQQIIAAGPCATLHHLIERQPGIVRLVKRLDLTFLAAIVCR